MTKQSMKQFDTIQYCIDNNVPCFTKSMNDKKAIGLWGHITPDNFKGFINRNHNALLLLTGYTYIMIDIDFKHDVPDTIIQLLKDNCKAYEKTPGGYHFYFLIDDKVKKFKSNSAIYWNNVQIPGIDLRAINGLSYIAPTTYIDIFGDTKRYVWEHGNLSTASYLPDAIFEAINNPYICINTSDVYSADFDINTEPLSGKKWNEIVQLVDMLSVERATNYSSWRDVIFCLRNTEYSERMLDLCHEFSKKASNYDVKSVNRKFNGRHSHGKQLTIKSLYYWAKLDSPIEFINLQSKSLRIKKSLLTCTNANIADVFYQLNSDKYLYSSVEGWYILQENNTWIATGSTQIKSIPNILNTIRYTCLSIVQNLITEEKNNEDTTTYKVLGELIKKLGSSSFLKGATDFLQGCYHIKDIEKKFNENRDLLAFNNGVLNTKTFTFRNIEPGDYITITTGYDYRPVTDSEKKMVKLFLSKIFPSDCVLNYILMALSTCLSGNNFYEFFHIFTGSGANGKSLLMDLCKIVLGEYFKSISVSYLTKDNDGKDKTLPELVLTRYARMLVASEPEEKDKFQTSFMKTITGNDEISCRGLYGTPVKFVPHFKLWILANDIPKFTKYDNGIERRTRCVHFPTRFVVNPRNKNEQKRDEFLKEKIVKDESWKYGLLGLLIDSLKTLQGNTLEMPKEVEEFTEKYLLENNPVGAWIKKFYDRTNNRSDMIQRTDLYNQFLQDTGINKSQKSFSEDMIKCYINIKSIHGKYYYYGIVRKNEILEE